MRKNNVNPDIFNAELSQHLQSQADLLASAWLNSLLKYCEFKDSPDNKYPEVFEIVQQLINLLCHDSPASEIAYKIGENISKLNIKNPECIALTYDAFLGTLTQNLSTEEVLEVHKRFNRYIVNISAGYIVNIRKNILKEQTHIRSQIEKAKDEAEGAKQKLEVRYKSILETIPETIIIIDSQGNILYFHSGIVNPNPIFPNLVSQNILDIIPSEFNEIFFSLSNEAHSTGKMQIKVVSLELLDKIRHFEARLVPHEKDKTLTVVREITEMVESQNALKLIEERLQEMTRQLITTQEYEKHLIALELHDQILSQLGALFIFVDNADIPQKHIDNYHKLIGQIRATINNLRPPMLNYGGLYPALKEFHSQLLSLIPSEPKIIFNIPSCYTRFNSDVELHIFRILQEAVTNALKHSKAKQIKIGGEILPEEIFFQIIDDGIGMPYGGTIDLTQALHNNHFGMAGMFERGILINAVVNYYSVPNEGTKVTIHWKSTNE